MKPFTLEWWLARMTEAELNIEAAHNYGCRDEVIRHATELADWIRQRIIKKYGENL